MCGIAGLVRISDLPAAPPLAAQMDAMLHTLHHRGPDGSGIWTDEDAGLCFGHRRLAIIDLSPTGHQPMASASGRFVVSFNGEIYNYQDLRAELETAGCQFRGRSDTEVIVEGFAHWGVETTLTRLNGMFAIAAWDKAERRLWLARDRMGEKPLYWGRIGPTFAFASELKALRRVHGWSGAVDDQAVSHYLQRGYVPAPASIYRGIGKLPPGHVLALRPGEAPAIHAYWDLAAIAAATPVASMADSSDLQAELESLLGDAVARRMVADVPLGAFLSGGIDSTAIVALMQSRASTPVKTFTIGFDSRGYDEAAVAKSVADHLGTEHTELRVDPRCALDLIPKLPEWYDEPFADSSQLPTFLVAQMARRHVTVALSGDGGDEVFAGYNRHIVVNSLWPRLSRLHPGLRQVAAAGMELLSPEQWDGVLSVLPARLRPPQAGEKVHKLATVLRSGSVDDYYQRLLRLWPGAGPAPALPAAARRIADPLLRMQVLDALCYLPDDVLVKVDRATMAVSLEARAPFLDHRLMEFACRLPAAMKVRGRHGKGPLRQMLRRFVPDELMDRPKMGFGVPIHDWLRGPLRDWAESLLAPQRLREVEALDVDLIRARWADHMAGRHNWQHHLWAILMLQSWRDAEKN